MTALLDLPDEVLIGIAAHIDILDVGALRKVCKRFFHLSGERSIWETILHKQSRLYPLPPLQGSSARTLQVETKYVESLATSVHTIAATWLRNRPDAQSLQSNPLTDLAPSVSLVGLDHRSLQDMHMLLDRWLVVVFQEGCYEVWDLFPSNDDASSTGLSPKGTWVSEGKRTQPVCILQDKVHGAFISSAACIDPQDDAILLALSSQPVIMILKIDVKVRNPQAQILASIGTTPFSVYIMKAIDPTSKLLVFGFAMNLHIWHWPTGCYWDIKLDEDEDEIYNMLVAAHFLTPRHLICLLNSCVGLITLDFLHEAKDIPPIQDTQTLLMNSLRFRGRRQPNCIRIPHLAPVELVSMRGAVFSQSRLTHNENTTLASTTFLAHNVLRGLFHFSVEARFPPSNHNRPSTTSSPSTFIDDELSCPPLDFTISPLAAHRMAQYTTSGLANATAVPSFCSSVGSSGFITTCALGSQGMRGIWVERHRNMSRSVLGFATADNQSLDDEDGRNRAAIRCERIHVMQRSYDLRDDLTHCALSEVTGTIILATRRGRLLLL